MAGLFASVAIKLGLDKLSSFLRESLTSPPTASSSASLSMHDDLEILRSLERTMRRIRATLEDAEEHWNIREESAKLRLEELKEVAYDAEDVVDEYEYEVKLEALERSAGVQSSNNKRKRHEGNETNVIDLGTVAILNELVVRARQIIRRYDEIIKDYGNLALTENDGERRFAPDISSLREVGSDVCERSILGREHDKDTIVEKLLPREDKGIRNPISVQAIVGMGGLGKTTLAQLVYNDPRVRQSFDMLAWVCVSDQFDVCNIMRKIIVSLPGDKKCEVTELAILQEKLLGKIKEQRVLLVLDDVWNERGDCWERLCTPLSKTRVCKIIVTTRSEVVAKLVQTMPFYRIKFLSSDESWSLFKQVAFAVHQENDTPANLVEIGRSIVEKCGGLPLAIKTLASMLRYETDEMRWRHVLESQLWNLEQSRNEVLPALELSYKHMPIYLKRCFVTLSLFPKDHSLSETEVLQLWKILDLLQWDGINNEDEIGNLYFGELVQRSFLQVSFHHHTMHDLVHDLACFLAGEEFFRLEGFTPIEIPRNARYMSVLATFAKISIASRSLRAIIVLPGVDANIANPEALFLDCKKLRALSLGGGNLSNALREYMGNLKLLRHLKSSQWPAPIGIGHLINLHSLPPIRMGACGCNYIRELRNLNKIRELHIEDANAAQPWSKKHLQSVCLIEDANEAQLWSKKHLQSLKLRFYQREYCDYYKLCFRGQQEYCDYYKLCFRGQQEYCDYCMQSLQTGPVTVTHEQLLDSLRPHYGLRNLAIEDYASQKYPNWLGNGSFYNLTKIELRGSTCQHVPTLGELPSLKSLKFERMYRLQQIGREFCSHAPGMKGFRSLTNLEFHDLWEWSEWSGVDDGDFPRLPTLLIRSADKLRSLPSAPFPSLATLVLYLCRYLLTVPAWPTLRELLVDRCDSLNELPTLPSLVKLELSYCEGLNEVPTLPSLEKLELIYCPNLSAVGSLPSLLKLKLRDCPNLSAVGSLPSLLKLELRDCPNLSAVGSLASVTTIDLHGPLPNEEILYRLLNYHPSLECVTIICDTMTCIPLDPQGLPSLRKLRLSCPNLQYCHGLAGLTSLKELKVWGCRNLPVHSLLPRQLQNLDIRDERVSCFEQFDW